MVCDICCGDHEPDEHEHQAGHKQHHCTDFGCFIIYLVCLGGLGWILSYCAENGDFRRLHHGIDFLGNLCGVDKPTQPLLFWCASPDTMPPTPVSLPGLYGGGMMEVYASNFSKLDLVHPICVESCPTSTVTQHTCYQGRTPAPVTKPPDPITGTFEETITYTFKVVKDYPTWTFAEQYCLPSDPALLTKVMDTLQSNPATSTMMGAIEIRSAWLPLVVAAILGFFLGYAYLWILHHFAKLLVYLCLGILILVPIVLGIYLVYCSVTGGVDGVPSTNDVTWDLVCGIILLVIALVVFLIVCCFHDSIDMAIGCVEAACECIWDLPSLLLSPLINFMVKCLTLILMMWGFLWLLSCGKMKKAELSDMTMGFLDVGGLSRSFQYTHREWQYICYYLVIMVWTVEISTAMSQFVLAYGVQLWYFSEDADHDGVKDFDKWCPLLDGYCIATRYHLGTLAFGSFIVTVLVIIKWLVTLAAKQAGKDGNPAAKCIGQICVCCVWIFEKCVRFLNKNAYLDCAVNSTSYCLAARNAFWTLMSNIGAVALLNGACWIFEMAGLGAITSTACALVWILVTTMPTFTTPSSDHYVQDPVTVVIVTACIVLPIAYCFMIVFDTVADTILYCYATDMKERGGKYAPPSLQGLMEKHHCAVKDTPDQDEEEQRRLLTHAGK